MSAMVDGERCVDDSKKANLARRKGFPFALGFAPAACRVARRAIHIIPSRVSQRTTATFIGLKGRRFIAQGEKPWELGRLISRPAAPALKGRRNPVRALPSFALSAPFAIGFSESVTPKRAPRSAWGAMLSPASPSPL